MSGPILRKIILRPSHPLDDPSDLADASYFASFKTKSARFVDHELGIELTGNGTSDELVRRLTSLGFKLDEDLLNSFKLHKQITRVTQYASRSKWAFPISVMTKEMYKNLNDLLRA